MLVFWSGEWVRKRDWWVWMYVYVRNCTATFALCFQCDRLYMNACLCVLRSAFAPNTMSIYSRGIFDTLYMSCWCCYFILRDAKYILLLSFFREFTLHYKTRMSLIDICDSKKEEEEIKWAVNFNSTSYGYLANKI